MSTNKKRPKSLAMKVRDILWSTSPAELNYFAMGRLEKRLLACIRRHEASKKP